MPRGAEIEQDRAAVHGDVDVGGLDVQVQQLVGVNLAQPVHQVHEDAAHEVLGELGAIPLHVELQRAAAHVLHDHVDGLVGAEEVLHAHDVGVRDHGERPPLLEEALEPVPEDREVRLVVDAHFGAVGAQGDGGGEVFLDDEGRAALVVGEVDDAETAGGERLLDAVAVEDVASRQRLVHLRRHGVRGFRYNSAHCRQSKTACKGATEKDFSLERRIRLPASPSQSKRARHDRQHDRLCRRHPRGRRWAAGGGTEERQPPLSRVPVPPGRRPARPRAGAARGRGRRAHARQDRLPPHLHAGGGRRARPFSRCEGDGGAGGGLRARGSAFPQARHLSVAEVLHWPGVLANAEIAADQVREDVAKLAAQAVAELSQTRRREGEKLAKVLRERLESMAALVAQAQPLMPEVMKAHREKLAARLAEAAAAPTDERIQQEVVLYAARIDVDEELERLAAHVAEFRRVLDKGGACGKRLDFLCQELNREANTLGSKSVSADMTRISVELKVLIEQMREQVQNIE